MNHKTQFKLIAFKNDYPISKDSEEFCLYTLSLINPKEFSSNLTSFEKAFKEPREWHNYRDDMLELSLTFPDTIFCLYAAREKQGDVWKVFWQAGETQTIKARLIFTETPKIYGAEACEMYYPFEDFLKDK